MKKAIYPLSADPIHNGHISNIERLLNLNLVDKLFIAIGKNYEKRTKYLFSDEEKLKITKKALAIFKDRVEVEAFQGLLAHYAKKRSVDLIIRGCRHNSDFENEQVIAEFNKAYNLTTLILPAPKDTFSLSSTMIKAITENGGLTHEFVPPVIKQALEEKILNITLIGVTGNTGAGKTSFCAKLAELNDNFFYIEVDKLIKKLYQENSEVRENVKKSFGTNIYHKNEIDRKKLASIIFSDPVKRMGLVEILRTPFKIALEESIKNLNGLILIDCAYLVEYNLMPLINKNIILLTCSDKTKQKRNKEAKKISEAQYSEKLLKETIKKQQAINNYGNFLEINTERAIDYRSIAERLKRFRILNTK